MSDFCERLKKLRTDKGLSQRALAQAIGYKQSAVAAWETGRTEPPVIMLIQLADFFRVTVDYLLGRTDEPQPAPITLPIPDNMIEVSPFEREVLLKYRVMPPSEQMYVCRMLQLTHPAQARANIKNA